jgi:hypothetical protein
VSGTTELNYRAGSFSGDPSHCLQKAPEGQCNHPPTSRRGNSKKKEKGAAEGCQKPAFRASGN